MALPPAQVSSFRDCKERKSLAVTLSTADGEGPRAVRRETGSGKFDLISLCSDDGYVKTRTANALGAIAGVYSLPTRFVRLLIESPRGEQADCVVAPHRAHSPVFSRGLPAGVAAQPGFTSC